MLGDLDSDRRGRGLRVVHPFEDHPVSAVANRRANPRESLLKHFSSSDHLWRSLGMVKRRKKLYVKANKGYQ